ncbi:acetyl-CoA carboxylase [Opitutaceae bacterium TAV5]|nr:acetyl-CoA carboxylase [Opitutaceae bacterium TAV5]
MKKVLIANRGEIAVRIIRACREFGCASVAVYSEADRMAPHVRMADEAYLLGPAPAVESYLRVDKLIDIAKKSGCDAVHPGYGFIAENEEAATQFIDAGIAWIGPSPSAIRLMGDKLTARTTAAEAGLPLVPGIGKVARMSDQELIAAAPDIGFPLLVKAAAGGGGKGMRIVESQGVLAESIRVARREAAAAFGDDRVYLERLVRNARHIEIQILGDRHGNIIHLGERDCSIQRRHQKLIEESPSPLLDEPLRRKMGAAAVAAARAVGYYSAGTVEFVVDNDTREFFFLEMNTRLQVEHTVSERVTGIDIVKEMLRVASGEPLLHTQEQVRLKGHCIECRIVAEDPHMNFLPSTGLIIGLETPTGPGVRLDMGVSPGSEVTPYYDSMLGKLVVWDETREEAIIRTRRALEEFNITGVPTTIPFSIQMMDTPEFKEGRVHTKFLEQNFLAKEKRTPELMRMAALAAALVAHQRIRHAIVPPGAATASAWRESGRSAALQRTL